MYEVTLDYAKNNFEEIIERAKNDKQGVSIVQDNKTFLLKWIMTDYQIQFSKKAKKDISQLTDKQREKNLASFYYSLFSIFKILMTQVRNCN